MTQYFFEKTTIRVVMEIEVYYHEPTGIVLSYLPPNIAEVQDALDKQIGEEITGVKDIPVEIKKILEEDK